MTNWTCFFEGSGVVISMTMSGGFSDVDAEAERIAEKMGWRYLWKEERK